MTRSPIELFWTAKNVSNFQETVISLSLFLPPISLIWWQSFVTLEITLSVDLAIMKWIAGKENTIAVWFKCNEWEWFKKKWESVLKIMITWSTFLTHMRFDLSLHLKKKLWRYKTLSVKHLEGRALTKIYIFLKILQHEVSPSSTPLGNFSEKSSVLVVFRHRRTPLQLLWPTFWKKSLPL